MAAARTCSRTSRDPPVRIQEAERKPEVRSTSPRGPKGASDEHQAGSMSRLPAVKKGPLAGHLCQCVAAQRAFLHFIPRVSTLVAPRRAPPSAGLKSPGSNHRLAVLEALHFVANGCLRRTQPGRRSSTPSANHLEVQGCGPRDEPSRKHAFRPGRRPPWSRTKGARVVFHSVSIGRSVR